jgi:hypothetical protein
MRSAQLIAAFLAATAFVACGDQPSARQPHTQMTLATTLDLTSEQRARLASRKIFFGHQSVGADILSGIKELATVDSALSLRVLRSAEPASISGPALVESPIGTNGDPSSKAKAFAVALAHGVGSDLGAGGIAMYKYCYLDFDASTDVAKVFREYREGIDQLKAANPGLTIVHITAPLTTGESGARALVKRILGKPTVLDANAKRNEFNALLRKTYGGREPLFDLAALESTLADGSRTFTTRGADTVYTLAHEYTDDGGHLNAVGRRHVAVPFLDLLASL